MEMPVNLLAPKHKAIDIQENNKEFLKGNNNTIYKFEITKG